MSVDERYDVHIGKSSAGWQFDFNRSMFGLFKRLYHRESDLGHFINKCRCHLEMYRSQNSSSVLEEATDSSDQIPPFIIWAIILHPRVAIFDEYGRPEDNVKFLRSVHGRNNERFDDWNCYGYYTDNPTHGIRWGYSVEFKTGPYRFLGSLCFS